jgi:hypothetical protein
VAKAGRRRWNVTASSSGKGTPPSVATAGTGRAGVPAERGARNSATIALTINGQVKTYRMATLQIVTLG